MFRFLVVFSFATAISEAIMHMDAGGVQLDDPAEDLGSDTCKCYGMSGRGGNITINIDGTDYPDLYNSDYGSSCQPWDQGKWPGSCDGADQADWCLQSWCFVDPCSCDLSSPPQPTKGFPGVLWDGRGLYYSYVTCGGENTFDADKEAAPAPEFCATPPDPTYGNEACSCIGMDQVAGTVDVNISGQIYSDLYPADLGARCDAWDAGRYPGSCDGSAEDASWCSAAWCYVDPCKCNIDTLPKPTFYLGHATYKGNPLYYSYATCDGTDTFTGADGVKPDFCAAV